MKLELTEKDLKIILEERFKRLGKVESISLLSYKVEIQFLENQENNNKESGE